MKRLFCGMLAAVMLLLAGCGGTSRVDVKQAKTLAELKGAKLAAQLIYFEQLFSAQLGKMLDYQFHMGFPHK